MTAKPAKRSRKQNPTKKILPGMLKKRMKNRTLN
jgi:hypothetical protein